MSIVSFPKISISDKCLTRYMVKMIETAVQLEPTYIQHISMTQAKSGIEPTEILPSELAATGNTVHLGN